LAREQRRLAAIVAADVVGYSRLMGRDESGTLARLREHRKQRFEPTLARHGGRLVKLTGDGALAEFPSAVDALGAAIEFQQSMIEANRDQPEDTRIVFRIGLHLGDLIVDGDDLYGDGVNVAALFSSGVRRRRCGGTGGNSVFPRTPMVLPLAGCGARAGWSLRGGHASPAKSNHHRSEIVRRVRAPTSRVLATRGLRAHARRTTEGRVGRLTQRVC
jgi:hypothetical protein